MVRPWSRIAAGLVLAASLTTPAVAESVRFEDGSVLVADEARIEGDVLRLRLGEVILLLPSAGVEVRDAETERGGFEEMVEALEAPDPAARRLAVAGLSAFDDPDARAAVLSALRDVAPEVRAEAVRALRVDESALPTERLVEMLRGEVEPGPRLAMVEALVARDGEMAAEWLGQLATDADLSVRQAARAALRRLLERR